jgi:cell division protein FtsN
MARDYKHRAAHSAKRKPAKKKSRSNSRTKIKSKPQQTPFGRWILAIVTLTGFVYFLYSLPSEEPKKEVEKSRLTKNIIIKKSVKKTVVASVPKQKSTKKTAKIATQEIQYDFYTLLPEAEFTIPDHEVKSIKRAERIGKAIKNRIYSVQVSSFRQVKEADSLKAKLLLLGFIPKIEKAKVNGSTWYRVKIGPYQKIKAVDAIVSRLRKNNIDAMVTAVNK